MSGKIKLNRLHGDIVALESSLASGFVLFEAF